MYSFKSSMREHNPKRATVLFGSLNFQWRDNSVGPCVPGKLADRASISPAIKETSADYDDYDTYIFKM